MPEPYFRCVDTRRSVARASTPPYTRRMSLGAVLGLALGIVVSVTTDVPFAPEAGLALGALVAWLTRRPRA